MIKKLLAICMVMLAALPAFAQQAVTGTVVDKTGAPLPGVVVQVKENLNTAVTDNNGAFSVVAYSGQTVNFTCLGLKGVDVVLANGQKTLNVTMEEDVDYLDEIVVVGYGTTKKRDLAGSLVAIKSDDVKAGVISNPAQVLRGRAAGVYVHQASNEPGGEISIRVRGASSISSANEPLYVIDGIQCESASTVAPADIETIEVLKDAASTAIYGARGANGVVIITTKKGSEGKINVSYGFDGSFKFMKNPYDLMDAKDKIAYDMKVWNDNGQQGVAPYTETEQLYNGAGTNWINEMTRTSFTQNHNISVSGGTNRVKAAGTVSYYDDKGIIKNTSFDRFNARINTEFKVTDFLRAGLNAFKSKGQKNYVKMNLSPSTDNVMYWMFLASPLKANDDSGYDVLGRPGRREAVYAELMDKSIKNITDQSYVTAWAEADLCKGLTLRGQYSYNTTANEYRGYYPSSTILGQAVGGQATAWDDKTNVQQVDGVITYHNIWGNHNFKFVGGTTWIKNEYDYAEMQSHGFTTDAFTYNNMGAGSVMDYMVTALNEKTNLSFFARVEYVLLDKYIFNASFRADGASNFGSGNKWGWFPSVSGAWQLGDEPFMEGAKSVLSELKIRVSWGKTGNDGIGSYKSLQTYSFNDVNIGGEGIVKGMYLQNAANPALCWETTSQFDAGFDFSLFKGKLTGSFDWYYKKTTDLLNDINVSAVTTGLSSVTGNSGSVLNRGWELSLTYNVFEKKNFGWKTILNLSGNHNEVTEITSPTYFAMRPHGSYVDTEYMCIEEGQPLSSIYGYVWDGVVQEGESVPHMPRAQPGDPKFKDLNNDGVVDNQDRKVLGKGTPDVILGWSNNFRLGDFDISFFFDGQFGSSLLNVSSVVLEDNNRLKTCMGRWTKANPSTTMPRAGADGESTWKKAAGMQYGSFVNSRFVESADFIRLSNLEVGYNLPVQKLGIKWMQGLRVFVGAQNLFTITGYSGFDPEVSSNGGTTAVLQGLDYAAYPAYRSFNLGAKITF